MRLLVLPLNRPRNDTSNADKKGLDDTAILMMYERDRGGCGRGCHLPAYGMYHTT